ncbi:HD domain-containing protein, partial [bacterium]|nr:HD domain-containing protein [bacterium]
DIATNATPDDIKRVFSNYKIIETGIRHNTLTIHLNHKNFEITTFKGNTIYEDLLNRDLTINSLGYNMSLGLIDGNSSLEDIQNKLIRVNHIERFYEDPLRMLRAIRFSAILNFDIEERTKALILENYRLLDNVSMERIRDEFLQILTSLNGSKLIEEYKDVFFYILPELKSLDGFEQNHPYHTMDVFHHTLTVLEHVKKNKRLCLAALFHDIGKPECHTTMDGIDHFYGHPKVSYEKSKEILKRLKIDNKTIDEVSNLILYHDVPLDSKKTIKKYLNLLGSDFFFNLLALKRADILGQNPEYYSRLEKLNEIKLEAQNILEKEECFTLKKLSIHGEDLLAMGFQGKQVGIILNDVFQCVIEESLINDKETILEYIQRKYK